MNFDSMGLNAALLRAINDQGYVTPTPIQERAIPIILSGRDILARAQTGTGKTAGFTLPMLQRLTDQPVDGRQKKVRALVLTPTRELAMQVCESVRTYGRRLPLRSSVVYGGVKIGPQIEHLRRGADIVVATPGRLLDHVTQRTIDLSAVEILVLDEADRMLDMGFIPDIRRIIGLLPKNRQTLLFSATLSSEIRRLAETMQQKPEQIDVAPEKRTAQNITQLAYPTSQDGKRHLLSQLIVAGDWQQVLVFTRTKHRADRVSRHLEDMGLTSTAIHGNKSQGARTRALADFKSGRVRVLVATDVAARGLDIEQLPHVVNFELPNVPEDYVHRIGRTGRAGMAGAAVSLIAPDEQRYLRDIERLLGMKIPRGSYSGEVAMPPPIQRVERVEEAPRREKRSRPANGSRPSNSSRPGNASRPSHRGTRSSEPRAAGAATANEGHKTKHKPARRAHAADQPSHGKPRAGNRPKPRASGFNKRSSAI
jgi:ATP-dependent RNA helicase RhlE